MIELRRTRPSGPTPPTTAPATTAALLPSPRSTAWLFHHIDDPTRAATLSADERMYVETVCRHCPALAQVRTLATTFRRLLTERDVNALAPWLVAAATSELRRFAAGIRRDYDAVLAAIVFPWSNGQTEGQVQRLKLLKRTMWSGWFCAPATTGPPRRVNCVSSVTCARQRTSRPSPNLPQSPFSL